MPIKIAAFIIAFYCERSAHNLAFSPSSSPRNRRRRYLSIAWLEWSRKGSAQRATDVPQLLFRLRTFASTAAQPSLAVDASSLGNRAHSAANAANADGHSHGVRCRCNGISAACCQHACCSSLPIAHQRQWTDRCRDGGEGAGCRDALRLRAQGQRDAGPREAAHRGHRRLWHLRPVPRQTARAGGPSGA